MNAWPSEGSVGGSLLNAATPAIAAGESASLLESVLDLHRTGKSEYAARQVQAFMGASTVRGALLAGYGLSAVVDREQILRRINRDIALLDAHLNTQLNAILHQEQYQRLEAAWRQLRWLVEQRHSWDEESSRVRIRVLNVTWKELARDLEKAVDFDQSQLFKKVYDAEFGMPGGEPFGLLIGDFEIHGRVTPQHPFDDADLLHRISGVAAAAFCPFITGAAPNLFGLDEFVELQAFSSSRQFSGAPERLRHEQHFEQLEMLKFKELRESEDARFLGIALPRVLVRLPYREDSGRVDGFCFREDTVAAGGRNYLWGNAAFPVAALAIRSFLQTGWLASIRGVAPGADDEGGLLTNLPVDCFGTDAWGIAPRLSTDVAITDEHERRLASIGFIPLSPCKDTDSTAVYSVPSLQKHKAYDTPEATQNARLSAQLPYMLCISRFAHYLKVLGRLKIGSVVDSEKLADELNVWLSEYITPDAEASPLTKSRRPLRAGSVEVHPSPLDPGKYFCKMYLLPHYQLDGLTIGVSLRTELAAPRPTAG